MRHNALRNVLFNTFRRAGLSSHLEVGSGWGQESSRTRPADIIVTNTEVSMYSGAAARAAELRKHTLNVLN